MFVLWTVSWQKNYAPEILVIGDSQISFGAGKVYLEFFDHIVKESPQLEHFQTAAIGVRSTSLQHWTTREEGKIKDVICEIDKRWGINAGVYGIQGDKSRQYVNIGQGDAFRFCKSGKSAFEAMFENGYYKPQLLILAFLGNSADRWADAPQTALADVEAMMKQIPDDIPCIFLTTSPSYDFQTNQTRWKAQTNIMKAFKEANSRCRLVAGFTKKTIAAAQGNKKFFKTNDEGDVTDIHHPNLDAGRMFFEIIKEDLKQAALEQLLDENLAQ